MIPTRRRFRVLVRCVPLTLLFSIGALVGALVPAVLSRAAAASATGIAFDQVEKLFIDVPIPADDGFDAQAAEIREAGFVDDSFPAPATNPMVRILNDPAGYMAQNKAGTLRRYSFMGSASRVDDLLSHRATIAKPDVPQIIYLDLGLKTYRLLSGEAAKNLITLSNEPHAKGNNTAAASEAPGQATVLLKVTTRSAGARTFSTQTASVYQTNIVMRTAKSTGSCRPISGTVNTATFLDERWSEPETALGREYEERVSRLSMRGCKITYEREATGAIPSGFILYRLSKLETTVPNENVTRKTATLLERANIVPLTEKDASLFEIPPGFARAPDEQP